ncbi:MAG: hypothetical protein Q7T55_04115 [Solirubrobacteraceae bacterium]|nr:hypothetical protein [Solirubrobacteraceae bacterium]
MSLLKPSFRRALPLIAVGLVGAGAVAAPVAGAAAAGSAKPAAPKLTASLTPKAASTGQTVTLTGKVKPAAKRTIRLEQATGKTWKRLATTTSVKKTGAFKLTLVPATVGTIKLRAAATKAGRSKALVSSTQTIMVSAAVTPPCCKTNPSPTPGSTPAPVTGPTPSPTPAPTSGPIITPSAARPSFRAIYAVASDQTPVAGKYAAITASANATNDWFATQTTGGVRPRWVRDGGGAIVVSTVRLPRPAAAYDTATFASLVSELGVAAPTPANQKTVLWFDVKSPNGCGVTGSGLSVLFEAACNIHPATSDVFPYGATYLTAHEMTHNFGAVASCAPHASGGGHVADDNRDLLYAGAGARDWANITLDPGHDDYYATGNPACPGIESSPYWTATSDPLS